MRFPTDKYLEAFPREDEPKHAAPKTDIKVQAGSVIDEPTPDPEPEPEPEPESEEV